MVLEHHLHSNSEGLLVDPQQLGKDVAFDQSSQDIFSISNGHTITRLNTTTGEPVWSWTSEDQTSLTIFDRLVATPETIYVIGVSTSFASLTLHVATLSASTGQLIQSSEIHGSIHDPSTDLFAFTSAASPAVVWLEQGLVKLQFRSVQPDGKKILDHAHCTVRFEEKSAWEEMFCSVRTLAWRPRPMVTAACEDEDTISDEQGKDRKADAR